jgi:hypothetical protein
MQEHSNLPVQSIPVAVKKYASGLPYPVALIGCRTSGLSLDCCEYDLAVFEQGSNEVLKIEGNREVEVIHLGGRINHHIIDLDGMIVLKDTNKFMLSSAAKDVRPEKYRRALYLAGKKSLINSLFYQQRMNEVKNKIVSAMWLKIAAYQFIAGSLAKSGIRPMPLHELQQIGQAETGNSMTEGIRVALECIGTERATRPAISRSLEAGRELKSNEYDTVLTMAKIRHLLDRRMLANCYYYSGRVAAQRLASKTLSYHNRYSKLIQLGLDLTSDFQHLQKLQKELFRATDISLKN